MIRDAATVLLVREAQGALQVYAQRRSQQLQAFAGVWVFPGGRVEEQDRLPHWSSCWLRLTNGKRRTMPSGGNKTAPPLTHWIFGNE